MLYNDGMDRRLKQTLLPLAAALIWGTAFAAQDVCAEKIGPFTFNALRFFIAVCFLAAVNAVVKAVRRRRGEEPRPAEEKRAYLKRLLIASILIGLVLAAASVLQQAGMSLGTDAGKSGFITALYIVLVPVFGLFLKKKVRPIWIAGIALALVGMYLLSIKGGGDFSFEKGDLLTFGCAVAFAVQILLIDRFSKGLDSIDLCMGEFTAAGIVSAVGAFFEKQDISLMGEAVLPLLYVAIFSSGVAYLLQIIAQKDGDPTLVSLLFSMESVFSVIAGAVLLGQRMTVREYAGCALILAAVVISQLPAGKRQKPPPEADAAAQ